MAVTGSDKFEGPQESPYHLWPLESDLLRNECEEDLLSPVVFNICGPGNATLCSGVSRVSFTPLWNSHFCALSKHLLKEPLYDTGDESLDTLGSESDILSTSAH